MPKRSHTRVSNISGHLSFDWNSPNRVPAYYKCLRTGPFGTFLRATVALPAAHPFNIPSTKTTLELAFLKRSSLISLYSGEAYHSFARSMLGNSSTTSLLGIHVPSTVSALALLTTYLPSYFSIVAGTRGRYSSYALGLVTSMSAIAKGPGVESGDHVERSNNYPLGARTI